MFARWLSTTLMCLVLVPATVRSGEAKKSSPPTAVVRVRSVDTVIENVKLIVALAGQENWAQQIEGLIKSKVGPNGLEGIDLKRPFGGYGRIGSDFNDLVGVAMVPIADEKAFLRLLENLLESYKFKAEKNKNGLYTVNISTGIDVAFRFANKYVYVTVLNHKALDPANLIDPAKIFPARQTADFSATIRLDQIPGSYKTVATIAAEQKIADIKDKKEPGETEIQRKFRAQVLDEALRQFQAVLKDGAEFNADLDINRQTNELVADIRLSARPDTELAKEIGEVGKSTSLFAGLHGPDTAARGLIHYIPPPAVRQAFEAALDEGMAKALASIRDEGNRKQAEALLKALAPTLKAGEIDAAFNFSRPDKSKHYNLVAAVKLKDGDALAKTVRGLVTDVLKVIPPAEADRIKLDAETAGDVKIHRIDAQDKFDDKLRAVFGENPIYVAFRDDAFFLALGDEGLAALRKAVTAKTDAAAPAFQLVASLAKLAPLLAKTDEQKEAVEKIFAKGDNGMVRMTIEGGSALRFRLTSQLSVLQFFGNLVTRGQALKIGD